MEPWRYTSVEKGFISFDEFLTSDTNLNDKRTGRRWIADSEAPSSFSSGSSVSGNQHRLCKQLHESSLSDVSSRIHGPKTLSSGTGNSFFLSLDGESTSRPSSTKSSPLGLQLGGFRNPSSFRSKYSASSSLTPPKRMRMGTDCQVFHCQVYGCNKDLSNSKEYHRKHKVCEAHSKAARVIVNGIEQRFCQQCSRFHLLAEFDDGKRSCRKRLAGHNERRRKPQAGFNGGRKSRLLQMYNTGTQASFQNGTYQGSSMIPAGLISPDLFQVGSMIDRIRNGKLEPRGCLNNTSSGSVAEEHFPSRLTFPLSHCFSLKGYDHPSRIDGFPGLDSMSAIQGMPEFAIEASAHSLLPSESTSSCHVSHPTAVSGSHFNCPGSAKLLGMNSQSSSDDLSSNLSFQGGRRIDNAMIYHGFQFGDGVNHLFQRGKQPHVT